jgi:hypothetical protein
MHGSIRAIARTLLKHFESHILDSKMGLSKSKYIVKAELNKNEMQLLIKSTSFNEEQINDFYSSFIDDCPNGYLTKKDFTRIFKQLHPVEANKGKVDKYCEYVFK